MYSLWVTSCTVGWVTSCTVGWQLSGTAARQPGETGQLAVHAGTRKEALLVSERLLGDHVESQAPFPTERGAKFWPRLVAKNSKACLSFERPHRFDAVPARLTRR